MPSAWEQLSAEFAAIRERAETIRRRDADQPRLKCVECGCLSPFIILKCSASYGSSVTTAPFSGWAIVPHTAPSGVHGG